MNTETRRVTLRYGLCTIPAGRTLDRYLFSDLAHARRWLTQPCVTESDYEVAIVRVARSTRRCPDCGYRRDIWLHPFQRLTIAQFLAQSTASPAPPDGGQP